MTQDTAFPLQLQGLFFTRSIVVAMPGYDAGLPIAAPIAPANTLDIKRAEDSPLRFMVTLRSTFNPESLPEHPYLIDMECMAIFSAVPEASEEEAQRAATVTGHQVTYGAIREAVMWLTSRQPNGPFLLGISVLTPAKASD